MSQEWLTAQDLTLTPSYLGLEIGRKSNSRIIAVSTSAVFQDHELIQNVWGTTAAQIDSGMQGHLYSQPGDIFVTRIPGKDSTQEFYAVVNALQTNAQIWSHLIGHPLADISNSRFALSCLNHQARITNLPSNFCLVNDTLPCTAASLFDPNQNSILSFTFTPEMYRSLRLHDDYLFAVAETNALLMNKNTAMNILHNWGVPSARTLTATVDSWQRGRFKLPEGRYVFKPAGGAAGIGVYTNGGHGASREEIFNHVEQLYLSGSLPEAFQIQEFIPGEPYGVLGYMQPDGSFEIQQIHRQIINDAQEFVGGVWDPDFEKRMLPSADKAYRQLAQIGMNLAGPVCVDMIKDKVIEVNPRLTAAAPMRYIRELLQRKGHQVKQVDLNSDLHISPQIISHPEFVSFILHIFNQTGTLVLPQGLNPFGASKVLFVNDVDGYAQNWFTETVATH